MNNPPTPQNSDEQNVQLEPFLSVTAHFCQTGLALEKAWALINRKMTHLKQAWEILPSFPKMSSQSGA